MDKLLYSAVIETVPESTDNPVTVYVLVVLFQLPVIPVDTDVV